MCSYLMEANWNWVKKFTVTGKEISLRSQSDVTSWNNTFQILGKVKHCLGFEIQKKPKKVLLIQNINAAELMTHLEIQCCLDDSFSNGDIAVAGKGSFP